MDRRAELKDTPSLMVTVFRQFSKLMQDEVALAKAEMSRNVSRAGVGLALIGVAAILALTALDVLAAALVAYLATTELSVGSATIIVGGALLAIAVVFALVGKSRLGGDALTPDRTAESLRRDIQTAKETVNG